MPSMLSHNPSEQQRSPASWRHCCMLIPYLFRHPIFNPFTVYGSSFTFFCSFPICPSHQYIVQLQLITLRLSPWPLASSAVSSRVLHTHIFDGQEISRADWPTGEIPSFKLFESDKTFAFLDIGPLSKGHAVGVEAIQSSSLDCSRLGPIR